jgi:DNA polymerase III subunit gamma/tau
VAYVSLYRKYRPQTFAQIVGQQHVTRTLAQALEQDRLHHAYLFTGPRGTGKTSTARILAKSLNCERGPTVDPDNTCAQCTSITSGSSIDVIEIDAASHGGVDDVRDLRDRVAFAPASARTKVYIVDECHMLSTAGWNAFLKTLEEPPGHVMFVFATTEPHKVLDTILSRTQRFDFKRIPAGQLADHIAWVGEQEGLEFGAGAVDAIVRAGDGSARDAMSVLEQVASFTGSTVTLAGVADVLGSSPTQALEDLVAAISDGDVAAACLLVQRLADAGQDLRQFSKDAVEHLRAVFLTQVAPATRLVEGTDEWLAVLAGHAGRLGRVELLRTIELLAEAQAQMRRGNTRLPLEVALAKACLPDASGDAAALAARLDRLERVATGSTPLPDRPSPLPGPAPMPGPEPSPIPGPEPGPSPAPTPTPPPQPGPTPPPEPDPEPSPLPEPDPEPSPLPGPVAGPVDGDGLTLDRVRQSWPVVMEAVDGASKRVHALARLGSPVDVVDGVVVLRFPAGYGFHAEQCSADHSQRMIGAALEQVLGTGARLRCVVDDGDELPPAVAATESAERAAAEEEAMAQAEEAERSGDVADPEQEHRRAIELVERDLGGRVVDAGAANGR